MKANFTIFPFLFLLLIAAGFIRAQSDSLYYSKDSTSIKKDTPNKNDTFRPNENLIFEIFECDTSGIVIDGNLNESIWKKCKKFGNFCEVDPGDNTKPPVETEVEMFYDKDNLYIGFICHESDMSKIRASVCDRDKMFNDDFVDIFIDTYGEGKQAYELVVNPNGIQGDLQWNLNNGEDSSPDYIWYSEAKKYPDKWTVEMAIPFKSIRFPDKSEQEWSIHLLRIRPRENRAQYSWIPINRDDPTLFTHHAILKGIKNVWSSKNIEIMPYLAGSESGSISDINNSDSKFNNEDIKGRFGFNVKYGITSNLNTDFAYNPDFSQVESDANQIDVNTTFALFYTEKRPFFLEGNSIFNTPINVVYTRSINKPLFAAKTSGRIGKFDIGYILAYDENSPFIVPFEERSDYISTNKKSFSNILRLKRNFSDESYIGLIFTDREVRKDNDNVFDIDGYNRVFGLDGNIMMFKNYYLTFQFLGYQTKEIKDSTIYYDTIKFDHGKYTGTFDGEKYFGPGAYVSFNRSAKYWNFNINYSDASPVARRDNGFMSNNDFRILSTWQGYMLYLDGKIIQRIQPQIYSDIRYDYEGKLKEIFLEPQIWIRFMNQIYLNSGFFLVNNEDFGGAYNTDVHRVFVNLSSTTFEKLSGGFYLEIGKYIVRQDNAYVGYGFQFETWQTIKPIDRLTLENDYTYYQLSKSYGGEKLYTGYLFRNKSTFQFNKNLFLRLIFQYDSFQKTFEVDPLFSYKLNPFTIFYIGSTHNFASLPNQEGISQFVPTARQFFLKVQYLWRM